ncbi:transposase [Streptomyces sp. NPDC058613]|uniref:transposase n=1 Tax=unclassified Streptomyces TaxID=2593676 RepID=UPI0036467C2D
MGGAGAVVAGRRVGQAVARPTAVDRRDPLAGADRETPWRDLPPEYGPWQTVCGLFRRWQRDDVWSAVLTGLQARADAAGLITWDVNVDSTICRARPKLLREF